MSKEMISIVKTEIKPGHIGLDCFFPVYNSDFDYMKKCSYDKPILCNSWKARNPKHHKLVFAMAKCVIALSPEDSIVSKMQPYDLIKEIMFINGMVDMKFRLNGDPYYQVKSIKFASMPQDKFEKVSFIIAQECARILKVEITEFERNYRDYL